MKEEETKSRRRTFRPPGHSSSISSSEFSSSISSSDARTKSGTHCRLCRLRRRTLHPPFHRRPPSRGTRPPARPPTARARRPRRPHGPPTNPLHKPRTRSDNDRAPDYTHEEHEIRQRAVATRSWPQRRSPSLRARPRVVAGRRRHLRPRCRRSPRPPAGRRRHLRPRCRRSPRPPASRRTDPERAPIHCAIRRRAPNILDPPPMPAPRAEPAPRASTMMIRAPLASGRGPASVGWASWRPFTFRLDFGDDYQLLLRRPTSRRLEVDVT
jgi:hypothetical protein